VIPSLSDFRRNKLSREQVRTFSNLLMAIALGRLPGEQSLSRRAAFTRFLVALVMSTALWYYVTDQENPVIRSQPFTLQVVYAHVPKGLAIRKPITTVTVFARGLQDTVNGSQQLLPIADLSRISPDAREATVPITISGGRSGVDYTSVPGTVTVRLEPLVSKTVPVNFSGLANLPSTLELLSQAVTPNVLTVSGPADEVDRVASATVAPPTTAVSPPNPESTSFTYPFTSVPILLDRLGNQIAASDLLSPSTRVTVILQVGVRFVIKTLTVAPVIPFGPPTGYLVNGAPQPRPQTVTVFGPPDQISTLRVITTQPISLLNLTKSMTITTHLDLQGLPPSVILYNAAKHSTSDSGQGGPAWSVYVPIVRYQTSVVLPAHVVFDHLSAGLAANTSTHWVQVYVTGAYLDIKALGPISAHVDTAGLVQGSYNLKSVVTMPKSLQNFSLTPATIHVVILPKPR
jgi:YbbR domain-containing protein